MSSKQVNIIDFQEDLLSWYRKSHRPMPWRAAYGDLSDPYHVWLSEIMLQQTTVVTVIDYFLKFTKLWPRVEDLAKADLDDVLTAWAGLGYYARARNLHKAAQVVVHEYQSIFPQDEETLLTLPGVGPYTAAAIASIAFNEQATVLDGNVERVVSRVFKIKDPLPKSKPTMMQSAEKLSAGNAMPSAYSQAMMELGAMVCKPKKPQCDICPVARHCALFDQDMTLKEQYPFKTPKKAKPKREGVVYWIYHPNSESFLIRQRGEKGLFAKMMELPSHSWEKDCTKEAEILTQNISKTGAHSANLGRVKHIFTHFELHLDIVHVNLSEQERPELAGWSWQSVHDREAVAFPSLMQKVIKKALLSI